MPESQKPYMVPILPFSDIQMYYCVIGKQLPVFCLFNILNLYKKIHQNQNKIKLKKLKNS